jgi:hypothetical protein
MRVMSAVGKRLRCRGARRGRMALWSSDRHVTSRLQYPPVGKQGAQMPAGAPQVCVVGRAAAYPLGFCWQRAVSRAPSGSIPKRAP